MRFLEWLFFLDFFFGDRDRKVNTSGCLPLILIAVGLFLVHQMFRAAGFENGLSYVFLSYLFISFWDIWVADTSGIVYSDGLKIMMFLSTIVGLWYISLRYLTSVFEESTGKYSKLQKLIFWSYVIPHVMILGIRIILTLIVD